MNCLKCGSRLEVNKCPECGFNNTNNVNSIFDVSVSTFESFEGVEENDSFNEECSAVSSNLEQNEPDKIIIQKTRDNNEKDKKQKKSDNAKEYNQASKVHNKNNNKFLCWFMFRSCCNTCGNCICSNSA